MNLELRESDILCSVFAAGLQSIVMGTGVRVSCVMSHRPVSYSVPVSPDSHTQSLSHSVSYIRSGQPTAISHHERDTKAQNIMEYGICGDHQFSIQQRPRAGAGWWRAGARTGEDTANITQHYTANITHNHSIIEYKH